MFASNAVDREFEPRSRQTKDYQNDNLCFSSMHAALSSTISDWLVLNRNNMPSGATYLLAK